MRPEAVKAKINSEVYPNNPGPNFSNPRDTFLRENALNLSGSNPLIIKPEAKPLISVGKDPFIRPINAEVFTQTAPEKSVIDQVKDSEVYNPSKRSRELTRTEKGKLIIFKRKRPSRCDNSHDPETDSCGSPRCKTKGRRKVLKENAPARRRRTRKTVVFGSNKKIK